MLPRRLQGGVRSRGESHRVTEQLVCIHTNFFEIYTGDTAKSWGISESGSGSARENVVCMHTTFFSRAHPFARRRAALVPDDDLRRAGVQNVRVLATRDRYLSTC
jgi:hypothetical protein